MTTTPEERAKANGAETANGDGGLTKRERFAMAAMQGMLTGTLGRFTDAEADDVSAYRYGPCNKAVVDRACVVADALLRALEGN